MNKIFRLALKLLISVVAAVVLIVLLAVIALNVAKFGIYGKYYSVKVNIAKNPALGSGFVCQGVAVSDKTGKLLVSGYMKDGSASRIYVPTLEGEDTEEYYVELIDINGAPFTGHVGGLAITEDTVYIANGGKIHTLSLDMVLNAKNGDKLSVGEGIKVNNNASFVYADEHYLYVGEFHNGEKYNIEGHENETAEGTHYAICTKYALSDLSTPVKIYSIRNKVQGICFTPDGRVIMSTSYGVADTVYYIYNEEEATAADKELDGAPVYYLDKLVEEIKGPAMGEDLDYYDGRVITLTESASNKYIFGKFFGANKIVGLEF